MAAYATMPIAGPIQYALKVLNDNLAAVSFLAFLGLSRELGDTQTLAFYFNALSFLASALILWRFVFHDMPSTSMAARADREAAAHPEAVTERDPMEEERSFLKRTWDEIREGWQFIYVNPVVRAVILGLATGLMGGAMLVPLGPTFARFVIGDPNTFPLFITALGLGVATGVVTLSVLQRRLTKERVFPLLVFGAGVSMFFGVSMSSFWPAALGMYGLGACAGAVYVLGFTLLQEHTDDELRGRIFATLLTLVRLCVLVALLMGPLLATIFNGFARAATGDDVGVPTMSLFGFDLAVPGVRLTLWLAALILCGAGVISSRSMKLGLRENLRSGLREAIGNGAAQAESRSKHPTSFPSGGEPVEGLGADVGGGSSPDTAATAVGGGGAGGGRGARGPRGPGGGRGRPGRGPGDRRPVGGRDGRDRSARPAPPPPAAGGPVVTGRFIVFEGGEGSGKSTQARLLAARLDAVLTRQPGGTDLGARIRELVLGGEPGDVSARAEALLMAADRAQHADELIVPALRAGRDVVCDRYIPSSVAYQGHGRGLDPERVRSISEWAVDGLSPDVVVLLTVPDEEARRRTGGARDRIEAAGAEFHRRVADGFAAMAAADPQRWVRVDGTGSPDQVEARVLDAVGDRLGLGS